MAVSKVITWSSTRILVLWVILSMVDVSQGLNLGLFAGDNKRHSNPLFIKKISRLSPVFININSGLPRVPKPNLSFPTLPPKPPPIKLLEPKLRKLKSSHKVPRSLLTPKIPPILPKLPILPPIIPKLPILPIIPPVLPPILPPLPIIIPPPLLPKLLPVPKLPKPIKVPILDKKALEKVLGSDLRPVVAPIPSSITAASNKMVLHKLLDLLKNGSLTAAEFIRFKKLLMQ